MRITRNMIIAGVIIVLFLLVAGFLSTKQIPQILPVVVYSGPVNISSVAVEINYANVQQQCFGQPVDVISGLSAAANSSQNILITLADSCPGISEISEVSTDTSGFRVLSANPTLPIKLMDGNKLTFNITVRTPASYSGVLSILVNAS